MVTFFRSRVLPGTALDRDPLHHARTHDRRLHTPTSNKVVRQASRNRPLAARVRCTATAAASGDPHAPSSPMLLEELRRTYAARDTAQAVAHSGKPRICVIGAGVVGLTTALRVTQEIPGAQVTIYADKFASDLASYNAAGVWEPYKLSETPEVVTYRWSKATFDHLMGLVHSDQAVAAGVQKMYSHSLFLTEEPDPFWASTVHGFRRMSKSELELFSRPVDWSSIQAAAAAATKDSSDTPGDGSIDSFTVAERATAFVDGYTFNTVSVRGLSSPTTGRRSLCRACTASAQPMASTMQNSGQLYGCHFFCDFTLLGFT
eukprot:GHUV01024075.1.p1 GENE.GHUV01024075.1~~GHUV01024075.1.p1  ORF type:complete len:318 (+),score=45.32 GHUV01024075.1:409-1362(+)